jgi:transcriptional regulator with XRE-family HTH domain
MAAYSNISEALRAARRAKGLSIAALAARAAVSPRLISECESGKRRNVSLATVLHLLELLDVRLTVESGADEEDSVAARAARANHRRRTWASRRAAFAKPGTDVS